MSTKSQPKKVRPTKKHTYNTKVRMAWRKKYKEFITIRIDNTDLNILLMEALRK